MGYLSLVFVCESPVLVSVYAYACTSPRVQAILQSQYSIRQGLNEDNYLQEYVIMKFTQSNFSLNYSLLKVNLKDKGS